MPSKTTSKRVAYDKKTGKSASTQAGEFVREEMDHKKEHKHPIKNRKQAIAIGLSKARKAGIRIPTNGKAEGKLASKKSGGRASASRSRAAKKGAATKARRSRTQESA